MTTHDFYALDMMRQWEHYTKKKSKRQKEQEKVELSFKYKTEKERRDAVEAKCKAHLGHEDNLYIGGLTFANVGWSNAFTFDGTVIEPTVTGRIYAYEIIDDIVTVRLVR